MVMRTTSITSTRIRFDSCYLGIVIFCFRNEKTTATNGGFFRFLELPTLRTKVTGSFAGTVTKIPDQCSFQKPLSQDISRIEPVTQGFHLGALSCPNGLDFKRLLPFERESRCERGDSAYTPNAQRRTSAQIQTQAGNEKTGLNLSRGLNRDSVVSGGGVLSERAEGRQISRNAG